MIPRGFDYASVGSTAVATTSPGDGGNGVTYDFIQEVQMKTTGDIALRVLRPEG